MVPCRRLTAIAAVLMTTPAPAASPAVAKPQPASAAGGEDSLERGIARRINRLRARYGLRRLAPSRMLAYVARDHSTDQLRMGQLTHHGSDGSSECTRVRRRMRARGVGETIAWLPPGRRVTSGRIMRMWMASPSHRREMLRPHYRRIGIGRRSTATGRLAGTLVTADFATRR